MDILTFGSCNWRVIETPPIQTTGRREAGHRSCVFLEGFKGDHPAGSRPLPSSQIHSRRLDTCFTTHVTRQVLHPSGSRESNWLGLSAR